MDRSVDELITLVEAFEDCCDALWNSQPSYPETRMRSLIQCMGTFIRFVLFITKCKKQLVLSLKQFGPQIALLLNEPGIEAEVEKIIETAMRNTVVLAYNPFTENNWKSRMLVTEKSMDSIIDRTIPVLKSRLQPDKLERNHLTADLEKYKSFLCREKIKEKLQPERETLLAQLSGKLLDKDKEIEKRITTFSERGRFLTEIAAKLENMQSLCSALLDDLASYPSFNRRMTSFMDKLKQAEQESYDEWCRETIQSIDDTTDSIALETRGRIMVLEKKNGTLNVNYSDRLLKLLKEVRLLSRFLFFFCFCFLNTRYF
uniref:DHC_N1 domain-containing protein n=1 Tax=Angiostrongylus cantonensis TaxID=6313 RepID=A0A0K0DPN9_ANGCA